MIAPLEEQLAALATAIATSPHNLVSRRERAHVRRRHVDEAVAVGRLLDLAPGERWMDLGTGGGLPGLVLALLAPDTRFVLLDSVGKKVEAVAAFAAQLGLEQVTPVVGRAEAVARDPAHREQYDGVVCRAVAELVVVAELARGFLAGGGRLVAVKGPRWQEELARAAPVLPRLGFSAPTCCAVPAVQRPTWLVTMHATGPCPPAYPRPDGVPRAHPLREAGP